MFVIFSGTAYWYIYKKNAMKQNNATIQTLHDLLNFQASKFSAAEVLLKNSLGDWIGKAGSMQLKTVLGKYIDLVQAHVNKLGNFIEAEKISVLDISDRIMKALVEEADEQMSACQDTEVRDACLLACVQGINHFKISIYGTSAAFAKTLNLEKAAAMFHEMEVNEKQIDDRLSQLAEHEINGKANAPFAIAR
jgi:ferritin-like metal-binding protein YciE